MTQLFSIGVETGDLSEWTATTTDGGNLSVSAGAALAGSYGMAFLINDTNLMDAYKSFTKDTKIRGGLLFLKNTLTMADGDNFLLAELFQGAGSYSTIVRIDCYYSTARGVYIRIRAYNDAGTAVLDDDVNISAGLRKIEFYAIQATNSTSNDGSYEWFLDGVSQGSVASVDNYNRMFDQNWRMSVKAENLDAGTSGTFYVDDVKANNDGSALFADASGQPTMRRWINIPGMRVGR